MNQQLKHTLKTYGRELIYALIIPLAAGAFSSVLTPDSSEILNMLNNHRYHLRLAFFPVVWTVLYIFMGLLLFLYTHPINTQNPHSHYIVPSFSLILCGQLYFFNLQMYLAAFFWLFLMWFLIIITIVSFL